MAAPRGNQNRTGKTKQGRSLRVPLTFSKEDTAKIITAYLFSNNLLDTCEPTDQELFEWVRGYARLGVESQVQLEFGKMEDYQDKCEENKNVRSKTMTNANTTGYKTISGAVRAAKSDSYCKAVNGFAIYRLSNNQLDYFPYGQPANINGQVDATAVLLEKYGFRNGKFVKFSNDYLQ